MSTGLRVKEMDFASKLVVAAMILHNLCLRFGDHGEEEDDEDVDPPDNAHDEGEAEAGVGPGRERRRNQLLIFFQRN